MSPAFFQEAFYSNRGDAKLLTQEERETCTNPSGLRSYLAKTFKKILMEGSSTINGYTNPANPNFHLTNYRRPISASF
jgi:hypothetical protein